MFIKAYASGSSGKKGTTVKGQPRPRKGETPGQYYERVGTSGMGATAKTRGKQATIRRVR